MLMQKSQKVPRRLTCVSEHWGEKKFHFAIETFLDRIVEKISMYL